MPLRPAFIAHPAAVLASLAAALAFAQAAPPVAPVKPVTDTYFGVTVVDPYRYMENMKDPEVAGWTKAQADYTHAVLSKIPGRATLYKEIETRGDAASARVYDVQIVGTKVYYQKRRADENIGKLYVRDGFGGVERLLVDPDTVKSADGKHSAIDWFVPSPDNKYLGYGMSPGGSEESVLHIIEVASGKPTGDVIDRANFGNPSWLDGSRFVYNRLQKLPEGAPATDKYQNSRVYVHRMGDDPDEGFHPHRRRRVGRGQARAGGHHDRLQASRLRLHDRAGVQRNAARTQAVGRARRQSERRQDAMGQDRGLRRRGHRCRDQRRHGLRDDAQRNAALQGAPHVARQAGSRAGRNGCPAQRGRRHRNRRGQRRALRAQDERREQRALPASVHAGCESRSRLRFRSLATSRASRSIHASREPLFNLGGWVRFGGYYAYDPRTGRSPIRGCSRRANTTIRPISSPPK